MASSEVTGTRRAFLRGAAGLALTGAYVGSGVKRRRVIDTHTHFYDIGRPQGVPWPPKTEPVLYRPHLPPEFRQLTTGLGVVGTVVVEASPWVEDNQWVLDLAKEDPFIVGFVGNLEVGQPEFAGNLRRFARNRLFRGIRLGERSLVAGEGSVRFKDDLRRVASAGLTLDVVGSAAMLGAVERIAREIPSLRIIIDHLPFEGWDGDVEAMRRGLGPLAGRPNIYLKVSNVVRRRGGVAVTDPAAYRAGLDVLWELFGEWRLIYGSNWPVSNRVAEYDQLFRIVADYFGSKGDQVAERYFYGNSRRFYRWIERGVGR